MGGNPVAGIEVRRICVSEKPPLPPEGAHATPLASIVASSMVVLFGPPNDTVKESRNTPGTADSSVAKPKSKAAARDAAVVGRTSSLETSETPFPVEMNCKVPCPQTVIVSNPEATNATRLRAVRDRSVKVNAFSILNALRGNFGAISLILFIVITRAGS